MHRKPRLVGGVKGHIMNDNTLPGSPALWAGSFTLEVKRIHANTALLQDIKDEDHQVITEIATLVRLYRKVDDESKHGGENGLSVSNNLEQ